VKILALDTATENCSAALLLDGAIITRERQLEHGHAGQILPMIDEVLGEAGLTLGALNAIAFGRGPGAFTGVRLAASVTQGLAFGAGIPVVPVSDLRALAQRMLAAEAAALGVLACTDARMKEVYWGCFERRDGLAAPLDEERLSAPEAVRLPVAWNRQAYPQGSPAGRYFGAGRGFAAYPALRAALQDELDGVRDDLRPRASEIAILAAREAAAGRVFPPEQALPTYLRDEVVQLPPHSH
jgi:tRNA threonylcarbamoyladenosine biosynthesis protein TsaB